MSTRKKNLFRLRPLLITFGLLIALTTGITWLVKAAFTTTPELDIEYVTVSQASNTLGGTGKHQVFRGGNSPVSGVFQGLDPGNPNPALRCPAGSSISFFSAPGIAGPIAANDYVYALRVSVNPTANVSMESITSGLCPGRRITGAGFCSINGSLNVPGQQYTPLAVTLTGTGITFLFDIGVPPDHLVPPGETTAVLFFTSPDPPQRQPASILGAGLTPDGIQPGTGDNNPPGEIANGTPVYGPCPATIEIDKKIGCSETGPFSDGPLTALAGSQVWYQITVRNTGKVPVINFTVDDPLLAPLLPAPDLTTRLNFPTIEFATGAVGPGLAPMGTPPFMGDDQTQRTIVVGPFLVNSLVTANNNQEPVTNTVTAQGLYVIQNQDGTPSDQTVDVTDNDSATLDVVQPAIVCDKKVNNADSFVIPVPAIYPVVLNYTLKATNSGETGLAVVIDDLKLKALETASPGSVVMTIQGGAGFAAGSLTGGTNLPATFPVVQPTEMALVNVTVTFNDAAALSAVADAANSDKFTNTMSATATVTNFTGCTNGAPAIGCSDVVMVTLPTALALDKTVACSAQGPFNPTATALVNSAVVYRFKVTNTGAVPISNITITDNILPGSPFSIPGTLAPGQMATTDVSTTAPATPSTRINTATANGTSATGAPVTSNQATATVTTVQPSIACDKRVNNEPTLLAIASFPAVLNYTLKITNTGGTDLSIIIDDAKLQALKTASPGTVSMAIQGGAGFAAGALTGGSNLPASFGAVPPGGMAQVNVTVTLANAAAFAALPPDAGNAGQFTNTMTAIGTVVNFAGCTTNAVTTVNCSDSVAVALPCNISLEKTVACGTVQSPGTFGPTLNAIAGSSIVYRFKVTNTGGSALSNIVINDNTLPGAPFNLPGPIAPGAMATLDVPATAPNTATTRVNTATATANCASGGTATSNQATATVTTIDPLVSCEKTVNGVASLSSYTLGTPLTYVLKATNSATSATNLNLTISDPALSALASIPGVTLSCKESDLMNSVSLPFTFLNVPPGVTKSVTCTVSFATQAALDAVIPSGGGFTNTMTATGTLLGANASACAIGSALSQRLTSSCTASVSRPGDECIITFCQGDVCRGNDPGTPAPATSAVSDQKPGSLLFYNFYTSSSANPAQENTRINLTNTAQGTVFVHLFFVDGQTCSVADNYLCLSANQTATFLMSDFDPGTTGYLVGVAVDTNGCPINWNYLIGDKYIKMSSGHQANLAAESYAAITSNPTGCTINNSTATIRLDGISYNAAARVLAVDSIPSPAENNSTMLIINRLGGDLQTSASPIESIFALFYDELENPYSVSFDSLQCQFRNTFSLSFPRTIPRLNKIIPIGQTGWMKFWSVKGYGLSGAVINYNSNAAAGGAGYNQGHNLHKLTLGGTAEFVIPVFPPRT